MKIKKLRITNYKSLVDVNFDKFTKINMLYGENNSGKSNILKFIELIFSPKVNTSSRVNVDTSRSNVNRGGLNNETEQVKSEYSFFSGIIEKSSFIFTKNKPQFENPIHFEIEVSLDESIIRMELDDLASLFQETIKPDGDGNYLFNFKGEIKELSNEVSDFKITSVNIQDFIIYNIDSPDSYFPNANFGEHGYSMFSNIISIFDNSVLLLDNNRYFTREIENPFTLNLSPLEFKNWAHNISLNSSQYKELEKIANQISKFKDVSNLNNNSPIIDLKFEFSRTHNNELDLMLSNKIGHRLPIESYGTGIQQIIYILAKIAYHKPRILLIEEIELNLSPKSQLNILNYLLSKFIDESGDNLNQILFTTHSPLLCFRSDFISYEISINTNGETNVNRISDLKKLISDFYPKELKDIHF